MENDGYDPMCGALLDDPDKAYQPACLAPDQLEDSLSEASSETDEPEADQGDYLSHEAAATCLPTESPLEVQRALPKHISRHELSDQREYRVEPILDHTTPAYAPSQTFGSPCESPLSSLSGGYPSPVSVAPSEMLSKPDPDRAYHPSVKDELTHTHSPIEGDGDLHQSFPHSPLSPPAHRTPRAVSPSSNHHQGREDFDNIDEDIDDNRNNDEFEGFEQDEQPESQVDGIIADIFGESDAEEEFEGFAENEVEKDVEVDQAILPVDTEEVKSKRAGSDNDDDDEDEGGFVSDFDKIMERKREELRRKRRRNKDIEFLNDSDDQIIALITRMKEAADLDRQLLADHKPAIRKLKLVSSVTDMLRRADLKCALVENGMLSAITEWLAPLPGHTLPNLVVRDSMLQSLREFQSLSSEVLQDSGIGKALMYLYKHPRETRENKERAGRLINEWLRPIFNLTSDYRTLTKEERKQLDYEHLPKRRNIDMESHDHRDINRELDGEGKGLLRPGDPGWVGRARVPQPSNKDYIVRPNWRSRGGGGADRGGDEDGEEETYEDGGSMGDGSSGRRRRKLGSGGGAGTTSRIETHIRNLATTARQNNSKATRAVSMSVEGRNMAL